jgi:hypothetical protein
VFNIPSMIEGSAYICAEVCWNPIAGPPARTCNLTPVSTPEATSGPVTLLCPASIL